MKTKISIWWILIIAIAFFALCKQCESEPKVVTKTETVIKWKTDTITKVDIKKVPEVVYVDRLKTISGKDSIVYRNIPDSTTIKANKYNTTIVSGKSSADLEITTTGELLDVSGTITYPEKETITETTITKDASGLYLYGNTSINSFTSTEIGLMFQFKNKGGIMLGGQYNNITKQAEVKVGALIKLF